MRLRGHSQGFMLEALAGVDIALWDLAGKILGQPLYTLLGGPFGHDGAGAVRVPCYASGVPGATLAARLQAAEEYIARGFTAMKLSLGRGSIEQDLAQAEALAAAIRGRADLLLDAHGVYDARSVVPAARRLEAAGVRWLEDPLPPEDIAGYAALCAAVDIPIASGETECTRWATQERLSRRAADVILPDICRAGGISEGRKIALVADLYRVSWCAHVSIGSWVHLVAALHLAAATPNFLLCEYPNPLVPNPLGDALLQEPVRYADGYLEVPGGPGLGIAFDEEALRAHTIG
jgi:L-alanine-DL-glutamate epimerase-like enolase superfamily enzyme